MNSLQSDTPDDLVVLLKHNNDIVRGIYGFSIDSNLGLDVYKMYVSGVIS